MLATLPADSQAPPSKGCDPGHATPADWEDGQVSERTAGWYPDPWTDGQYRYWTGTSWTADAFPDGPAPQSAPSTWSRPSEAAAPPPQSPSAVPPAPPQWGPPPGAPQPEVLAAEPWTLSDPAADGQRRSTVFLASMLAGGLLVGFLGVFGAQSLLDRSPSSAANPPAAAPFAPQQPSFGPPSAAAPSTAPAPSPGSADPAVAVLPDLVVRQSDVASTVTVAQIPHGTSVSDAATLDLCNGTFASESLRTARLQVAASDSTRTDLSTEAVAYRNRAATTSAFAELKAVAARCPDTPVTSPVGEQTVTTKFSSAPDASWPHTAGVDRQAYSFTSTDASGTVSPSVAVYLKRGRILLGLYFPQPAGKQSPVAGQTTIGGIVKVFQNRMAALPSSVTA